MKENAGVRALSSPKISLTTFCTLRTLCMNVTYEKMLLYSEVPTYFTWNTSAKKCQRRRQGKAIEGHSNLCSTDTLAVCSLVTQIIQNDFTCDYF